MVNRISELDFVRGILIVVICLNHMHSFISKLTNQPFGFVSAMEGFIFVSGLVSGIVYFNRYKKNGFVSCSRSVFRRSLTVYKYHVFVVFILVGIGFIFKTELSSAHWPWPPLIGEDYIPTLFGYVFLYDLSPHLQILPIYVVLLIFIPAMVFVCVIAGPFYLFLLSLFIWFFAQLGILELRMGSYNFYSWQVLFVFGFSIGVMKVSDDLYIGSKYLQLIIFAMFFVFLLYRYQENIFDILSVSMVDFSYVDTLFSKRDLGPFRLMNFVVIAYVIYYCAGRYSWLFRSVVLERIGKKSLEIFTFQIFLVFALSAFSIDLYFEEFYVNAALTTMLLVSLYCYARYADKYL